MFKNRINMVYIIIALCTITTVVTVYMLFHDVHHILLLLSLYIIQGQSVLSCHLVSTLRTTKDFVQRSAIRRQISCRSFCLITATIISVLLSFAHSPSPYHSYQIMISSLSHFKLLTPFLASLYPRDSSYAIFIFRQTFPLLILIVHFCLSSHNSHHTSIAQLY